MSTTITHKTAAELEAGLESIRQSPRDCGVLQAYVDNLLATFPDEGRKRPI